MKRVANISSPLTNAVASMQEKGLELIDIITGKHTDLLLDELNKTKDNTLFEDHTLHAPTEEVAVLKENLELLEALGNRIKHKIYYQNVENYDNDLTALRNNVALLESTNGSGQIDRLRQEVRFLLIDAWHSLAPMVMPRFLTNTKGEIIEDSQSFQWSPQHYKISAAWPMLEQKLRGKRILDPFAGPGIMITFLASALDVPVTFASDISYAGGKLISDTGTYRPDLNYEMFCAPFINLPPSYKPQLKTALSFVTADARELPFQDAEFDYVVTDPPYGITTDIGYDVFLAAMPELLRVTKDGIVGLVPMSWKQLLHNDGYEATELTGELCKAKPTVQTQYLLVTN